MEKLNPILRKLSNSKFFTCLHGENCIMDINILENGIYVCQILTNEIKNIYNGNTCEYENNFNCTTISDRFSFITSKDFRSKCLQKKDSIKYPFIINKHISYSTYQDNCESFLRFDQKQPITKLVTDFVFNSYSGLENYFKIQRERKIWWMRLSTNPSRYFLDPYTKEKCILDGQSVTIKSKFPFANLDLEQVTYVSLRNAQKHKNNAFDINKTSNVLSVVRSVINLETAACALLLDASIDTGNDALLLNKKLAPYQCVVICSCQDAISSDLKDLIIHISYVLSNAGIRLLNHNSNNTVITTNKNIQCQIRISDHFGVPYALIINETTLINGLLKLRSRDTLLNETIHITDLPNYLQLLMN